MSTETPILIADDHPIVRQGLRQTIETAEFRVVAEASDGQQALELLEQLRPAIAVLDIDMPLLDGFAVARVIRERNWPIKVVFLTVHREPTYLQQALSQGACAYVLKDSAVTDIVASLRAAQAGQAYLSPLMANYLVNPPAAVDFDKPRLVHRHRRRLERVVSRKGLRRTAELETGLHRLDLRGACGRNRCDRPARLGFDAMGSEPCRDLFVG